MRFTVRWQLVCLLMIVGGGIPVSVQGQPIVPAMDGTDSRVISRPSVTGVQQFDITGGQLSSDGANLFHSLQSFGLNPDQIANFLSSPGIENILTRVVGGQPSLINGLIQVTGGNSYLFLMNPSGVIFGDQAQLNVPASFLVTTATGIGFGDQWFSVTGTPNYAALLGSPGTFAFSSNPSAIVNQGQLGVPPGQSLTLLGGSVINTGTLTAPGGQITVAAIPGENIVRISQPGHLLSLELPTASSETSASLTPFSLPELLTGGVTQGQANEITVNGAGQIVLTVAGQPTPLSPGTALISGTLNTAQNFPLSPITPTISILGNRIGLAQTTLNASGVQGGGIIKIGGDFQGGSVSDLRATETYISPDTLIQAEGWQQGNGGQVSIWSDGTTRFYGQINARGGDQPVPGTLNQGGFVEVSGRRLLEFKGTVDTSAPYGLSGTLLLDPETIVIRDGVDDGNDVDGLDNQVVGDPSGIIGQVLRSDTTPTIIYESELEGISANTNLMLSATSNIIINDLSDNVLSFATTSGNTVTLNAGNILLFRDFSDTLETQGGNLNLIARSMGVGGLNANGGNITLTGNGIDLVGGVGSVTSVNGQIQIQPQLSDREVRLGAITDDRNALDLTLRDLNALGTGFDQVIMGRSDSTGDIQVIQPLEFQNPLTLQTQSGSIIVDQALRGAGNSPITLNAETISLGANITTENQNITINGNTILTAESTLSTGTELGDIRFNGTINGGGNPLVLGAGAGTVEFTDDVSTLMSLNIQAANTEISGNINTQQGGIQIDSDVTLGDNVIVDALGNFLITNPEHQINTQGFDLTILGNNIRLGSVNTRGGNLSITASRLDFQGGENSVEGAGGIFQLESRPLFGITMGGVNTSFNETSIRALADGWQELRLGSNSNRFLEITDPVTFTDPVVFSASRLITVNGAITGQDNSRITVESDTILNNNITTNNQPITFNRGFELRNNVTLDAGNSEIEIKEAINGNHELKLNANQIQIDNNIGDSAPLAGLEITAASAEFPESIITNNGLVRINLTENLDIRNIITNGGNIELNSQTGTLNTQILQTTSLDGLGGNVTLTSPNTITVESIAAAGGQIDITTDQFFRATGTFTDPEGITASLSTAGGNTPGSVTIRHGGGDVQQPFEIGDPSVNGTAGAINTSQSNQITPLQSFPGSFTQGTPPNTINLITTDPPAPPAPTPSPIPTPIPTPIPLPTPMMESDEVPGELITDLQGVPKTNQDTPQDVPLVQFNLGTAANTQVLNSEQGFSEEYEKYLGLPARPPVQNLSVVYDTLRENEEKTGIKSAIIYINFLDQETLSETAVLSPAPLDDSQLNLVIVTANGQAIQVLPPHVNRKQVLEVVRQFQGDILNPRKRQNTDYLQPAQQLYQWLIAPLIPHLETLNIQNLVFIPPSGLRSLPFAALHDGNQFLVENYSLSIMPSLGLSDTRYTDIRQTQVLAMGASEFETKPPLYAVPVELSLIIDHLWPGRAFLNENFTLANLQSQRLTQPFEIIHLATHADFQPGVPQNSYIQLWDQQLDLKQMQQLRWNDPQVKLLVLSACSTALGDEEAELGFAGLAVNSGARSVLATLWAVSDQGTLALMAEFYRQLRLKPIKAVGLQAAQIAMIRNQIVIEDRTLRFLDSDQEIQLPSQWMVHRGQNFTHPFYWAGFTLIGNPW